MGNCAKRYMNFNSLGHKRKEENTKKLEKMAVAMHCNLSRPTSRQAFFALITKFMPSLKLTDLSVSDL